MVSNPSHVGSVWLAGSGSGLQALANGLRDRGLHLITTDFADVNEAPIAMVFLAPRPAENCTGPAIADYVANGVAAFVAAAQKAVRCMTRDKIKGSLVIVTDIAGIPGRDGHAAAATLSGALIGAAKCLAKELGRQSISVNVVAYGFVPELGAHDNLRPAERKLFELMNLGKPGGIAHLVENIVHLVGNRHLMTGQVLHADDGLII
jgi:NAD(P)-dependent dehydrogenase (short-subunit alcohol dehydrogenase family)